MDSYKQYEIREGIVFLIEVSKDIFKPLTLLGEKCQFEEILRAINELIEDLVISLPSTGIGIYLYNCDKTDAGFKDGSGIRKIFRLSDINSRNMKLLNDYLNDNNQGISKFQDNFIPGTQHVQDNLPFVLNTILSELISNTHYNNRKLIWMTNNDDPYHDSKIQRRLWRIINDYDEYKININPFFLDSYDNENKKKIFKSDKFESIFLNSNILNQNDSNEDGIDNNDNEINDRTEIMKLENVLNESLGFIDRSQQQTIDGHDNMYYRINQHKIRNAKQSLSTSIRSIILRLKEIKRVQFSCDLILSDGKGISGNMGCSVKGYTIYNHEKPRRYESVYNLGELTKLVHVRTRNINENNGETIPKLTDKVTEDETPNEGELERGYDVGGDILYLREKQMKYLKNYGFDHNANSDVDESATAEIYEDDLADDIREEVTFSNAPYLKLIGFRKLDLFKPFYNSSNVIFVTADLNNGLQTAALKGGYQNSFTTFSSLYQGCVKLKRYGIVFGCTKKNSIPALYVLYPTRVQNSSKNSSIPNQFHDFPQGFFLIRLPWVDDIRSLPEYALGESYTNSESNELFDDLVKSLKLTLSEFGLSTYQPIEFPNPQLNYFYKILRMNLLEIEVNDDDNEEDNEFRSICKKLEENDYSFRKLIELRKYLKQESKVTGVSRDQVIKDINSTLNKISNNEIENKSKRSRADDNSDTNVKKEKKEVISLTDQDILTCWKNDVWDYLTVPQLRGFINNYNGKIKKATKKADMIANIIGFLDKTHGPKK